MLQLINRFLGPLSIPENSLLTLKTEEIISNKKSVTVSSVDLKYKEKYKDKDYHCAVKFKAY